jgi:hypothetical protein
MVGEQEFHYTFSCFMCHGRVGLDDHAGLDGPRAGSYGFGYSFDFDKAHTTVTGDEEFSGRQIVNTAPATQTLKQVRTRDNKIWES